MTLRTELENAVSALTAFDVDRLEAAEQGIRRITAAHLAQARESLPELLSQHALLGQMLAATAANLRVLTSVLHIEARDGQAIRRSPWRP